MPANCRCDVLRRAFPSKIGKPFTHSSSRIFKFISFLGKWQNGRSTYGPRLTDHVFKHRGQVIVPFGHGPFGHGAPVQRCGTAVACLKDFGARGDILVFGFSLFKILIA